MTLVRFNINDNVRVKLTPKGKAHYLHKHEEMVGFTGQDPFPFEPKKEDKDGWSTWQLWDLMNTFGDEMRLGATACFEDNEILLEMD